jgi:predicted unusual protein kinase regulating ubiquinone biosynthesis (AarF/ABC1/UbiB family)
MKLKEIIMDDNASFVSRIGRIANVSTTLGGVALKTLGNKVMGNNDAFPNILTEALGKLKGPVMKVGQILAMVPGILPEDVTKSLVQLQSNAPAMGWPFVRRRMAFELGADWQDKFTYFEKEASMAASLGQVHKAQLPSGEWVACKLQYPNMLNIINGDLDQLRMMLSIYEKAVPILDTVYIQQELNDRLKEELDYQLELQNMERFHKIFMKSKFNVIVPKSFADYSTGRLLTMEWCDGADLMEVKSWPIEKRQLIAKHLFQAWYYPLYRHGILHGDPHFGNYRITENCHIILLDFGCVREFSKTFLEGSIQLYAALERDNMNQAKEAYEMWGFTGLTSEIIEALNIWAKFLYEPLLDNRVRPLILSDDAGKKAAKAVIDALKQAGTVRPPKEFVFMDRAAVGIGSAMIHLGVELNWHQLFQDLLTPQP